MDMVVGLLPAPKKLSVYSLRFRSDCSAHGIQTCQAACCHIEGYGGGRYVPQEFGRIDGYTRSILKLDSETGELVIPFVNHKCALAWLCKEGKIYKPVMCRLFPLKLNRSGTLLMAMRFMHCFCPNARIGLPLYVQMKDAIIDAFGSEFYERVLSEIADDAKPDVP